MSTASDRKRLSFARLFTIVLAFCVAVGAPASTAFGGEEECSCGDWRSSIWDYVEDSDAVFVGVVEAERAVSLSDVAWQVEVVGTYKGDVASSIEVLASDGGGYSSRNWCGQGLAVSAGHETVFFGSERDGMLVVDRCDPFLSPSDLREIIAPAAPPDGSGEAWAVGLGWQNDANLHVLDGTGRRLAAARIDAALRSGVQCEGSSVVAIDARDDEGPIILRFDVATMTEIDRLRLGDSNQAKPMHCDEDLTVVFARLSADPSQTFLIESISSGGSNRLVAIAEPEDTFAVSWPFAVIAPNNGDIEPVQIIDLRANSIVGLINAEVDREVDRLGFVDDSFEAPTMLWVTTVNREQGQRQVNEIVEVDLAQTPLEIRPPLTITDQLGPVQNYLENRGLLPQEPDDSDVQWVQADGTDLGRQVGRDRVPGRNGEIVATSAGIAFLDSGTGTIVPPFDWTGDIDVFIPLPDRPSQITPVMPPPLFSMEAAGSETASTAETQSYVVDLPTVELPATDDGEESPGGVILIVPVIAIALIGFGLYWVPRARD